MAEENQKINNEKATENLPQDIRPHGLNEKIGSPAEQNETMRELEKCVAERDANLAGWQRAKADFINYKKEEAQRMTETIRYANGELIREMIGVLDNFDLGLAALEKQGQVEKGIYMIRAQIADILKRWGLERIEIKKGDIFDPSISEAVAEVDPPAGGDGPPGSIVEEIETGYRLGGKVIRPARVKISK